MNKPNLDAYYETCRQVASDLQRFATFRTNPQLRVVTDTNTLEHGLECERWIMQHARFLLPWLDTFRRVDSIGMPPLYQFQHVGLFNPTTLRHIVTLVRIQSYLSGVKLRTVVEIGSSYGALAALMQMVYSTIEAYHIWENPLVYCLTAKFLDKLGLSYSLNLDTPITESRQDTVYDLVISCYAFSELDRETQDWYLEHVLSKAQAGYMVMNTCAGGYTRQELAERLHAEVLEEIPHTHNDNYTLVWRNNG